MEDVWFVAHLFGSIDSEDKTKAKEELDCVFSDGFKRNLLDAGVRIGDVEIEITHVGKYDKDGNIISG